jgi:signal transduction histidine kinase
MVFYTFPQFINVITACSLMLGLALKRSRFFSLMALCGVISGWAISYILWQESTFYDQALMYCKVLTVFSVWMPYYFFNYVLEFSQKRTQFNGVVNFNRLAALFFSVFTLTNLMISHLEPQLSFPFWPMAGPIYPIFLLHFFACFAGGYYILIKGVKSPKQAGYFFVSTVIGLIGGSTNFFLWFGIPVPPVGNILLSVHILIMVFAITKHDLIDIRFAITRTGAFLLTLIVFASGYLVVIVLPYHFIFSRPFDIPFLLASILYGGLGVGLYFHRIQQFFQTSAYRKFLNFSYNFEETLKTASSKLVRAQETEDVLGAIFEIQSSLEIGDSYAILKEDDGYNWYVLNKIKAEYEQNEDIAKQKMKIEPWMREILPAFDGLTSSVSTLAHLPESTQKILYKNLGVDEKLPYLAIHSFQEIQAVFILGQKLSEEDYTAEELSLFEIMLNQAITVFERITQTKKIIQSSKETAELSRQLQEANIELDLKLQEAIALAQKHFHQAALSSMVSGIAHEIRNPMSTLFGSANLLARIYDGKRNTPMATQGLQVRKLSASKSDSAWRFYVSEKNFFWAMDKNMDLARQVFDHLKKIGLFSESGELTSKFDLVTMDMDWIELGPEVAAYREDILEVITQIAKKAEVFRFLNTIGSQIPRILSITDNMLKYGISGGGVNKDTFVKIAGIEPQDSEAIFQSLVTTGYLDHKGNILPKFKAKDPQFLSELSSSLPGVYHTKLEAIVNLIIQTPGTVKEVIDIQEIVLGALSIQEGSLRQDKIQLITQFPPQIPHVFGDGLRLQQAIFNILYNAQQAMESCKDAGKTHKLTVTIKKQSFQAQNGQWIDGVCISISDTGNGMSEETRQKIFNPFFTTKDPAGGKNVGLGLSILREVVLNHDGSIDVESTEGEGSTFKVFLPVYFPEK